MSGTEPKGTTTSSVGRMWRKIRNLHSHHDPLFLHKGLGFVALGHYIYRFGALITTGSMGFRIGDPYTFAGIMLHLALSFSALIFRTPVKRTAAQPMMWKEFQLHSITFATRSLGVMLVIFFGQQHFRGVVVLTAHLVADEITRKFKQGTTMRDMPFPSWMSEENIKRTNLFYAISQIFAIVGTLLLGFDEVFLILFPIQWAAFLLTLVRKNIISAGHWHALYSMSLGLPYLYLLFVLSVPRVCELVTIGVVVGVLRFRFRMNKYLLWCPVALSFLLEGVLLGPKIDPATGCVYTRWTEKSAGQALPAPAATHASAKNSSRGSWKLPGFIMGYQTQSDSKTALVDMPFADDSMWVSP